MVYIYIYMQIYEIWVRMPRALTWYHGNSTAYVLFYFEQITIAILRGSLFEASTGAGDLTEANGHSASR